MAVPSDHDAPVALPPSIPLTISFFFAWMVAAAVLFRIQVLFAESLQDLQKNIPGIAESSTAKNVGSYVSIIVLSAALATWMYVVKRLWDKQIRFPTLAGHWICLLLSAAKLLEFVAGYVLIRFVFQRVATTEGAGSPGLTPVMVSQYMSLIPTFHKIELICQIIYFFVLLIPIYFWKQPGYWRIFFLVCAILSAIEVLSICEQFYNFRNPDETGLNLWLPQLLNLFPYERVVISGSVAVVCLILDLRNRGKLDWLHWLGVVVLFISQILERLSVFL